MPQKRRPYKSKIKGCYECSQRRIDCDRSEPQCQKCISKGLECNGLGVRHRFNNGVASRGKWTGKAMELAYQETYGRNKIQDGKKVKLSENSTRTANISVSRDFCLPNRCNLFQPSPDNTPPWKQSMLLHFSNHIATEMVGIDGMYNGWRHLILPIAQTDDLVMDAVLVVSAFHLSLRGSSNSNDPFIFPPRHLNHQHPQQPNHDQLYTRAIRGLQQRRELSDCDQSTKSSVLLAILVLLTAVMVTGHSDFPTLFRMLQSAVDLMGGEEGLGKGELAEFILRQVHKMRVYAAPLLSEQMGCETISSQAQMVRFFDCLNYCSWQHPEHSLAVSYITDLVYQARDIYLHQVLDKSPPAPPSPIITENNSTISHSISRVQQFKETLEAFPHDSPGEQVLIWASFVAASDCVLDEHKAFFKGVFLRHYARSGFANLLRALEYLQRIWARAPGERWTSLLPQAGVFIM